MIHKTSKSAVSGRHEVNYLRKMAKYGSVLAIGFIATLCVGAVFIIYRIARGRRKSGAQQTDENSSDDSCCDNLTEKLKDSGKVNNFQESHTEGHEETLSMPSEDQCVNPREEEADHILAVDSFSNSVTGSHKHVQKHLINSDKCVSAHTKDPTEHHDNVANWNEQSKQVDDQQEQVNSYSVHAPNNESQTAYKNKEYFNLHHEMFNAFYHQEYVRNPPEVEDSNFELNNKNIMEDTVINVQENPSSHKHVSKVSKEKEAEIRCDNEAKMKIQKDSSATHILHEESPIGQMVAAIQPTLHSVRISFRTHFITHSPSELLAVTGNLQELGGWEKFVPLNKAKDGFWVNSVTLPMKSQVEWKFVLVENGKIQRWEECNNRQLETGSDREIDLQKWWGYL